MLEIRPSGLKRYQNIAGTVGFIGFLLGTLIPGIGILTHLWQCPFGNGILQTVGFLAITGFGSAIIFGNLAAILLLGILKYQRKEGSDGN